VCILSVVFAAGAHAQSSCSAYGDPPAQFISNVIPTCPQGGTLLGPWNDSEGTPRYACEYQPSQVPQHARLPLIVFLHGSTNTADSIPETNLLDFIDSYNFGGKRHSPGFILIAPEGRDTTHYYPGNDSSGTGWDNWYRQLSTRPKITRQFPTNVDAATIDHFIAAAIATGKIDQRRVYLMGRSNGAAMGYLYALNRPAIAAAALYSAPDPWAYLIDPCEQTPVRHKPKSIQEYRLKAPEVPTYQVHNACDLAGICPNTEQLIQRLRAAKVLAADQIIGSPDDPLNPADQQPTDACIAECGADPNGDNNLKGAANHDRWPTDWTTQMLDFLKAHPRHAR